MRGFYYVLFWKIGCEINELAENNNQWMGSDVMGVES
jgi:hypothetical protein